MDLIEMLVVSGLVVIFMFGAIKLFGIFLTAMPKKRFSAKEALALLASCPTSKIALLVSSENAWIIIQTDSVWIEVAENSYQGVNVRVVMAWRHVGHIRDLSDGLVVCYQSNLAMSRDQYDQDLIEFILQLVYRSRSPYYNGFSRN